MCQKSPERCKVGDTLTVTVEDENGEDVDLTDAKIQWFAGETALEGETDDELEVTLDMLGEVISVIVTIDDVEYTASAEEEVEVRGDLEIEAVQTGANEIVVTSNNQIKSTDTIALTQAGTAVANTPAISDDGKTITLVTAAKLKDAEYTVKITTALEEEAECTVDCKAAKLDSIKFGETLALVSNTNFYVAQCMVTGADQFGDDYDLGSNLTVYPSIATATDKELADNKDRNKINDEIYTTGYDSKTKTYTVVKGGSIPFQVGDTVTMTGIYQNGTTTVQGQGVLTVSNAAYISELEFADFDETCTQNASLVGKRVTVDNFRKGTYYLKVVSAEDQYGNVVTAQTLNNAIEAQTLFINPVAADGAYGGVGDANDKDDKKYFDTLDDGTIILKLDAKKDSIPGEGMITIAGLGGLSVTPSFYVDYNPYIAELNVTVPALVAGKAAELTVTATDNYDDEVDLYEYFDEKGFWEDQAKDLEANAKIGYGKIELGDQNGLTKSTSSLAISAKDDAELYYQVSYSKKTVKFFYYHVPSDKATTDVLTISTASPKVTTQTLTIAKTPKIAGLAKGLSKTTSNKGYIRNGGSYVDANSDGTFEGNAFDFTGKIYVIDEDGDYVSAVEAAALQVPGQLSYEDSTIKYTPLVGGKRGNATALTTQPAADTYYYVLETSDKTLATMSTDPLGKTDEAGNEIDNSTGVNATLYFWDDDNEKLVKLDSADYKVRTVELNEKGMYESYEGKVGGGLFYNTLWDENKQDDVATVTVTGYDAENDFVTLNVYDEYTISVDQGLRVYGSAIYADPSVDPYLPNKVLKEGTATVRIFDTVKHKEQDVQTFDYSNDTPVATKRGGITDEDLDVTKGTTYSILNGVLTINGAKTFYIADQYELPMTDTLFTIGGKQIKSAGTTVNMVKGGNLIYANSGDIEEILNVGYPEAENGVEIFFPVIANNVTSASVLQNALSAAAVSGSADTITVRSGSSITVSGDLVVAEEDTLVIPYGATVTVTGDAYIYGTVRGANSFGLNNRYTAGTLEVDGDLHGGYDGYAKIDLPDDTLVLKGSTVYGKLILNGHTRISGDVTIDGDADVRIIEDSTLDFEKGSSLAAKTPITIISDGDETTPEGIININIAGEPASGTDAAAILASIETDLGATVSVDSKGEVKTEADKDKTAALAVTTAYEAVMDAAADGLDALTLAELKDLAEDIDAVQEAYAALTVEQKALVKDYDEDALTLLETALEAEITEREKNAQEYSITYTGVEAKDIESFNLEKTYTDETKDTTDDIPAAIADYLNGVLDEYFVEVKPADVVVTASAKAINVTLAKNDVYAISYTIGEKEGATVPGAEDEVIVAPKTTVDDVEKAVVTAVNDSLDTTIYNEIKADDVDVMVDGETGAKTATVTLTVKTDASDAALESLTEAVGDLEAALAAYEKEETEENLDAVVRALGITEDALDTAENAGATTKEIRETGAEAAIEEGKTVVIAAAKKDAENALKEVKEKTDSYKTAKDAAARAEIIAALDGDEGLIAVAQDAVDAYAKAGGEESLTNASAIDTATALVENDGKANEFLKKHAEAIALDCEKAGFEWTEANKKLVNDADEDLAKLTDPVKTLNSDIKTAISDLAVLKADMDATATAETFRTSHKEILAKTADNNETTGLKKEDETALKAAEDAYKAIDDEDVKAKLKTEAKKLEDLRKYMKEVVNKPTAPTLTAASVEAGTETGTIKFAGVSAENEYALAATNTAPAEGWSPVDGNDISDAVGKYLFVRVAATESAVASDASAGLQITKDMVKAPEKPIAVTAENLGLGSAAGTFRFVEGYGTGLQYALANSDAAPTKESAWKDVTTENITKGDNTHIFVRVKATDKLPASEASEGFEIPEGKVLTAKEAAKTEADAAVEAMTTKVNEYKNASGVTAEDTKTAAVNALKGDSGLIKAAQDKVNAYTSLLSDTEKTGDAKNTLDGYTEAIEAAQEIMADTTLETSTLGWTINPSLKTVEYSGGGSPTLSGVKAAIKTVNPGAEYKIIATTTDTNGLDAESYAQLVDLTELTTGQTSFKIAVLAADGTATEVYTLTLNINP